MANDSIPPQVDNMLRGHDRRLKELERRLTGAQIPQIPSSQSTPPFSFPGLVVIGSTTPIWVADHTISYLATRISARAPGVGDCDVEVHKNGSTVLVVTAGSGIQTAVFASAFGMVPDDYLDMEVAATAGQIDVSIQLIEASSS